MLKKAPTLSYGKRQEARGKRMSPSPDATVAGFLALAEAKTRVRVLVMS